MDQKCVNCGEEMDRNEDFCGYCGHRASLQNIESEPPIESKPGATPVSSLSGNDNRNRIVIQFLVTLAALAAGVACSIIVQAFMYRILFIIAIPEHFGELVGFPILAGAVAVLVAWGLVNLARRRGVSNLLAPLRVSLPVIGVSCALFNWWGFSNYMRFTDVEFLFTIPLALAIIALFHFFNSSQATQ